MEAIDGYYPVVQRSNKAVLANLRVRLSLISPPESLEQIGGAEQLSAAVRPPRATLRSNSAKASAGRSESGCSPATRAAEPTPLRESVSSAPVKISTPRHATNTVTSRTRPARPAATLAPPVPAIEQRRGSKVTFSDSDAAGRLEPRTLPQKSTVR